MHVATVAQAQGLHVGLQTPPTPAVIEIRGRGSLLRPLLAEAGLQRGLGYRQWQPEPVPWQAAHSASSSAARRALGRNTASRVRIVLIVVLRSGLDRPQRPAGRREDGQGSTTLVRLSVTGVGSGPRRNRGSSRSCSSRCACPTCPRRASPRRPCCGPRPPSRRTSPGSCRPRPCSSCSTSE